MQEVSEFALDLLSFCLWATEAKHPIIGIPHVTKSAVVGVFRVLTRQFPPLLAQDSNRLSIPSSLGTGDGIPNGLVRRIFVSSLPASVLGKQHCFDKRV